MKTLHLFHSKTTAPDPLLMGVYVGSIRRASEDECIAHAAREHHEFLWDWDHINPLPEYSIRLVDPVPTDDPAERADRLRVFAYESADLQARLNLFITRLDAEAAHGLTSPDLMTRDQVKAFYGALNAADDLLGQINALRASLLPGD